MNIVFHCLERGRRLYAVRRQGEDLFVGTREQCDRFREIHERKVLEERAKEVTPVRRAPFEVRTYRKSKVHA